MSSARKRKKKTKHEKSIKTYQENYPIQKHSRMILSKQIYWDHILLFCQVSFHTYIWNATASWTALNSNSVTKLLVTHGHGDAMIMTSESHSRGHGDQAILHLSCNDFGKAFYIPWSKKLTPSGPLLFFCSTFSLACSYAKCFR